MRRSLQLLAATALCAGAFVQTAAAQDVASAVYGSTRIYVGGGFQYLSLPDIKFTGKGDPSNFSVQKNSDSDWLDFGGVDRRRHRDRARHVGRHRASLAASKASGPTSDGDDRSAARHKLA